MKARKPVLPSYFVRPLGSPCPPQPSGLPALLHRFDPLFSAALNFVALVKLLFTKGRLSPPAIVERGDVRAGLAVEPSGIIIHRFEAAFDRARASPVCGLDGRQTVRQNGFG